MISQVRWREGVKEEIPNLLAYHAKAQFSSYHQLLHHFRAYSIYQATAPALQTTQLTGNC